MHINDLMAMVNEEKNLVAKVDDTFLLSSSIILCHVEVTTIFTQTRMKTNYF